MSLPDFNENGELPEGVHQTSIEEIIARFGSGSAQRRTVTGRMVRVYELAKATEKLNRFIIFGSYITAKADPEDVDIVMIMSDDFQLDACSGETMDLFDHMRAQETFGASLFWMRPSLLFLETLDDFIAHWQIKRDNTHRGIVEVRK